MTRRANARVAGITFLVYIVAGITTLMLSGKATAGQGIPAKLASVGQHTTEMGVVVVLTLLMGFCALTLGVTLYSITREQDPDLAMMGLVCRVIEAGAAGISTTIGLVWLATATGPNAPDSETARVIGALFLRPEGSTGAIFFAVASTLFSWLLLRGRMVPVVLARLGVFASALLVVILPLQLAGFFGGDTSWFSAATWLVWLPALAFEVWLALWLIIKGVAAQASVRR
ncbi:MAG TPA: DUF4386 domain-containing protein [Gemmatimonadaceae bacterium]|nr:DUF4386 domain-containing protein [Gemmatimonadaceae bacterium]